MPGEHRLLIIAIDDYPQKSDELINAKRDALRIEAVLQERYGFSRALDPVFDSNATGENILKALIDLSGSISPEDNLIIYYAGHGVQNQHSKKGFWVPYDGEFQSHKYILNSTVLDLIEGIQAKHILLISDSCYSGTFITQTRGLSGKILTHDELDSLDSRWVFVSGGEERVGDGPCGKGSPFSSSLAEFFEKNLQSSVSAGEVFNSVIRTTEARARQKPNAAFIISHANKGGEMIFRLRMTPVNEVKTKEKLVFDIPVLQHLDYYIPRTVTAYEHQKTAITYFFEPERGRTYLKNLIPTQNRIVLLGTAGSGKSIELQQLSRTLLTSSSPLTPVYKRFNTYIDESIEDYLPPNWEKVQSDEIIILLDGLDEVQPQHLNTAIRKIIAFAEKNKDVKIIVSCRTNFYEFPTPSFSGTLEGFEVQILNDISLIEVKNYVTDQFKMDGERFINDVHNASFLDLIQKPYFLDILIKHYIANGFFRTNRVTIMEEALVNYFHGHKNHFKSTGTTVDRDTLFNQLEKIAFVMEVMGKNFITDTELHKVFTNSAEYGLCKYLPAFNRDSERGTWMFDHNNLQEFLASRILSRQSIENLVRLISTSSAGINRVKPTWVNTLSFLISIDNSETVRKVVEWIVQNDIEILIRFEPDRVNPEQRIGIFKRIFNFYGEKEIWLASNKFSDEDLARFGKSREVLDFLISKLDNNAVPTIVRLNAVRIIKYFELRDYKESGERVRISLLSLLETKGLSHYGLYSIFSALAELGLTDKRTLDFVVDKFRNDRNQYIRAGLYKLLHHSPLLDDYLGVFLDGLDLGSVEGVVGDRDSINLMDESFHLKRGLENIKTHTALKILLYHLAEDSREFIFLSDYKELIQKIVQNCIHAYTQDKQLYESVLTLFVKSNKYFDKSTSTIILRFFEETDTKWKTFLIIWRKADISYYELSEFTESMLDRQIFDEFLAGYKTSQFSINDLEKLHQIILWNNDKYPEGDFMLKEIETAAFQMSGVTIERPVRLDWEKMNKDRVQKSFDLLFDGRGLMFEIENIYARVDKTVLAQSDLFDLRVSGQENLEDRFAFSALDLLREFTYGGVQVEIEFIRNWMEKDARFLKYQIDQIYTYLTGSYSKLVAVNDDEVGFIRNWCINTGDNRRIIWYFIQRFDIKLPEDKLLDLTFYYDYNAQVKLEEPGTIDHLEKFISITKLTDRVMENLTREIPNPLIWSSNASYAIRRNQNISYPLIIDYIENFPETEYKLDEVLTMWFHKTGDTERLRAFIENVNVDPLRWTAIWLLFNAGMEREFLSGYLRKIMKDDSATMEIRFRAVNHLFLMDDMEAFNFSTNHILKNQDPNFDYLHKLLNMPKLTHPETVPKLLEMLELGKRQEFQIDPFNSLESVVVNTIYNVGIQSEKNLEMVRAAFDTFMKTNKDKLPNLNFLHFQMIKIEEQINLQKSKKFSIDDAILEWRNC